LHLAMDPAQLRLIPANVLVDVASSTVFGAKFVQLVAPAQPSAQRLQAGAVLEGKHVTVEINTVFQQLTAVLAKIDPAKLNETLGAVAAGMGGRGGKIGQMLTDLDALLAELDPVMPALRHDLAVSAAMTEAYGDAAPDLVKTARNAIPISQTIIDERENLDAALLAAIGLADTGNDVLSTNRKPLTDVMHLGVPTTDLFNEYHEALTCGFGGVAVFAVAPPPRLPGLELNIGFDVGQERYRYPGDLPRVAATGGPQCTDQPLLPFEGKPPAVVADTGSNPFSYGNQRMVWDNDLIKQWLYGPLDGPPRNSAQITQPG
ncbi:MAG TPA: MCE family protein, partial [Mycobacterium sp.]|nr:MCE family protein [Mycobacterium sp.]